MNRLNNKKMLFSNWELLSMLFPIIINDLAEIFVGLVDSIMVSSVGEAAVSGISLVGSTAGIFTTFLGTLAIGCTVVVSQYIGSRNYEKAGNVARQSVFIGLGFGVPILLLLLCFISPMLHLIYPDTDPTIMENARTYFLIFSLIMPPLAVQSMLLGTIRAIGKNKLILLLGLAKNLLNIVGNALLIRVFHMGVAGAAIATVISSYTCCFICFILTRNKKLAVNIRGLRNTKFEISEIKQVLSVGLGTSFERCSLVLGKILVTAMYADLSAIAISAYYVSRHIITICWTMLNGFGTVLMTVVGQCIGADEPEQAKYYTKKAFYIAVPFNLLINGILFLTRNQVVHIYDLSGDTLLLAAQYTGLGALLTIFCFYPIAIIPAYSFRAAGDTRYATVSSTVITILCQVGLCFLFVKCFHMGIVGVWLGMGGDWLARAIVHSIHFSRNKWLTKKVI